MSGPASPAHLFSAGFGVSQVDAGMDRLERVGSIELENEQSVGGSEGGGASTQGTNDGPLKPGARKNLAEFRDMHAKCIEVLKRTSGPSMKTAAKTLTAARRVADRHGNGELDRMADATLRGQVKDEMIAERQVTDKSTASSVDDLHGPAPVSSLGITQRDLVKLVEMLAAHQENSSEKVLLGLRETLTDMVGMQDFADFRCILEAQGRTIESLQAQDVHICLRALKESIETSGKMDAQRSQDTHLAIERLKELLVAQGCDVQAMKAQNKLANEGIQERLEELSAKGAAQHKEHAEELRQLRAGLAVQQAQCEEALRQRDEARESASNAWREERRQLEDEISRLKEGAEAAGHEIVAVPAVAKPRTNSHVGSKARVPAAATAIAVGAAILTLVGRAARRWLTPAPRAPPVPSVAYVPQAPLGAPPRSGATWRGLARGGGEALPRRRRRLARQRRQGAAGAAGPP